MTAGVLAEVPGTSQVSAEDVDEPLLEKEEKPEVDASEALIVRTRRRLA